MKYQEQKKMLFCIVSGTILERKKNGINKVLDITIEMNNTGITAFFCKDNFLQTSYMPSERAEKIPKNNHIYVLLNYISHQPKITRLPEQKSLPYNGFYFLLFYKNHLPKFYLFQLPIECLQWHEPYSLESDRLQW